MSDLKRPIQDQWFQDHRVPGKFIDILFDPAPGATVRGGKPAKRWGKSAFIVDDVKSYGGERGKAPQICIVDVIQNDDGSVVRKPNWRAYQKSNKAGRTTHAYQQIFFPLDRVKEICYSILKLAGSDVAADVAMFQAAKAKVEERTEEQKWQDEKLKHFRM